MRITAMTLMAALTAVAVSAAEDADPATERTVTVCISAGSGSSLAPAQALASKMFAGIGVTIHWRFGLHGCPPEAIGG